MLPSWWSDESTLVLIDIGIDESKSSPSPLLVVSAIVGKTPSMRRLDSEWKRDLSAAGVDYFHATEHWNLKSKAYHGISTAEREKLLNRLVAHTQRRFLFGVTAVVDETEYRSFASPRFQSQQGSPYGFAFQEVMVIISIVLGKQQRFNQPINILIEDGHKNAQQVIELIDAKKKRGGGLTVATHGLGAKKDNPILQAADMLAFGMCEFNTKGESDLLPRLIPDRHAKRFLAIPWHPQSIEAVKSDIVRNSALLKVGDPRARMRTEMVMW